MNAGKTHIVWIGTRRELAKSDISELVLSSFVILFAYTALASFVLVDGQMSTTCLVASVCRSSFFLLRQLRLVYGLLTLPTLKTFAHYCISGHLDYRTSLLDGTNESLLTKLQSVQNAVARSVTSRSSTLQFGQRRTHYITPVLRDLHLLPV